MKTRRESRILQGFDRFEALEHGVNHVFCELLSPSGTSPEEQLRPARIDFGLPCENGSLLLKSSYGNGDFVAGLGGGPGGSSEG